MEKYQVVSLHFDTDCNLNCPMCYRHKYIADSEKTDYKFWLDCIPYLKQITDQIACLSKDDYIFVAENGCIKAKKISKLNSDKLKIITSEGIQTAKIIKKTTNEKMYKIFARGNRIIKLTENHLIQTTKGLKKIKDLEMGDKLEKPQNIRIEEIDEIDISDELSKLRIKHRIDENGEIVIERLKNRLPRKIKITKEFARLCGYYVSQGYSRGFSFHKKQVEKHKHVINAYNKIFPTVRIVHREQISSKLAISIEVSSRMIQDIIFRKIMKLGTGAKNKSIGKAFFFKKDRILDFIEGMFAGDGNIRVRKSGISINYTTCSETLAKELRLLLETRLGIICSLNSGTSKKRNIGKRILSESDYYKICIYGKTNMKKLIKHLKLMTGYKKFIKKYNEIGNKISSNKKFLSKEWTVLKIEPIEQEKTVYDVKLKSKNHLFISSDNIIVHNCGGGEPFLHPEFIMKFAKEAKKHDLIVNVTTNGTIPIKPEWLENITMISVSYDRYKWPKAQGLKDYLKITRGLKESGLVKVGCNFLMEDWVLKDYKMLIHMMIHIFGFGKVDSIFALLPKNTKMPKVLEHRKIYNILTFLFDEFYVDDCTRMLFENDSYNKWKKPCHFGSDMVSIDELKNVTGCSFSQKPLITLKEPKDILKIPKLKYEKRYECPYLKIKS